jgi:hypothetical protein
MKMIGYALLCYVVLMLLAFIKFPMFFFSCVVLSLLFVGFLAVFGYRIPLDTDLWAGGAGE